MRPSLRRGYDGEPAKPRPGTDRRPGGNPVAPAGTLTGVGLLRDLRDSAPRRVFAVALLVVLAAAAQATGSALAGQVLLHRSGTAYATLAVALVLAVAGDLAVQLLAAGVTADWAAATRRRLCGVAFGQDLPTLESTPVGELLDRIDSDVQQVASELRGTGTRLAQAAATAVASVVAALVLWWPAGLVMAVLGGLLVARLAGPASAIGPRRVEEEEAWSDLAAVVEEAVHGQDDVRTSLAQPYVLQLYADRAARVLARGRVGWRMAARLATVAGAVTSLAVASVVVGGVVALRSGRVDGARLTAVWLLVLGFASVVERLSRSIPELQNALGAYARVRLLDAAPQEPVGGLPVTGDLLTVEGLTFAYAADGSAPPALTDVTLAFAPGRSYAVIGRTGSGKSTLAKVLTRAVEPPRGTVHLGGTDVLDLDLEALRRAVAVVPQRTEILAATLAENVALHDPALVPEAGRVLDELGLSGWVAGLPDGLATRLGDGGQALSAGQEQLVAFARILVRDPRVVVLDEATARMDPVTEERVQRATRRLLAGRTGIVIAHRLSSVRHCDEVVVLAGGRVVEAGPLRESDRFAELLATGAAAATPRAGGGTALAEVAGLPAVRRVEVLPGAQPAPGRVEPPALPEVPRARALREVLRLVTNDPRYGLAAVALFTAATLIGLEGTVLPALWASVVDGQGSPTGPALAIVVVLALSVPVPWCTGRWFPEWWVRQMLRISLRLVHGQTGARRVSGHTPAEVVAQGGDTERVVVLADNMVDNATSVALVVATVLVTGSALPALLFGTAVLVSGGAAAGFGRGLARCARRTVAARAAFVTALASALAAARTVKLGGGTGPVLDHLARLDAVRAAHQRREVAAQVWARSTPSVLSGLLPVAAWGLYLAGALSSAGVLVAVSTLASARWFAWTTASLVSSLPSARVWTRRTVAMTGRAAYSELVEGVDLSAGTAWGPAPTQRRPLESLRLKDFGAVHEDGTVGAHGVDLTVSRGELVLVVGPVGSGKSSLLRALAGLVHAAGSLEWNGEPVRDREAFLRPAQVGYVAQLPRVLSGTVADNVGLAHGLDASAAVSTAQLAADLDATGHGLGLLIGHKGTRLSGGQLQRLALARALAPQTELLVADDVSSALDVTTELALWSALRASGVTVVGSTSKRAALARADRVVVLQHGEAVAQGTWAELEPSWRHLAG